MTSSSSLNVTFPDLRGAFRSAANIAELRRLRSSELEHGQNCITDGAATVGDKAGRIFVWDATSAVADDGLNTIRPDDVGAGELGRWVSNIVGLQGPVGPQGNKGDQGDGLATVMAPGGSALVGYQARTVAAKLSDNLSTADKTGSFLTQLQAVATDLNGGGKVFVPTGVSALSGKFTFAGQRLDVEGKGPNVSVVTFDPASASAAIELNTSGAGGQYQSRIAGLGFLSSNTVDKTAIDLINVANVNVERIGIPGQAAWGGTGSIGIRTRGRQFVRVRDVEIACARPVVVSPNATFPSIAGDYSGFFNCELSTTINGGASIEVESGTILSNFVVRDCALTGGSNAFKMLDTSAAIQPNTNLQFENIRTEQGKVPSAFSFDIQSQNNTIQSVTFINVRCDNARNGIRLRNVQRVTFIGCDFDQVGSRTLLDVIGVPGTVITMIGCWGQAGGALSLTNLRRANGLRSDISSPIGPFEQWVYDNGSIQPFTEQNTWTAGKAFTLAPGGVQTICANDCQGKVEIYASNQVNASFRLFGTNNQSHKIEDPSGQFNSAFGNSGSTNVAYNAGNYVVQNNTAGTMSYRLYLTGPGNAGF